MKSSTRSVPPLNPDVSDPHPIARLEADDLDMITTFVLESGSIKALALRYGVSYPTMRQRLDGLIERLRNAIAGDGAEPLNEYLATLIEEGRIAPDVARNIRDLHTEALETRRGSRAVPPAATEASGA